MPTHVRTTHVTTSSHVAAVHHISFRGLAGAIFILVALSCVLYVIGFSTTAWAVRGSSYTGLWQRCTCYTVKGADDWFHAVQAMITIGLIGLFIGMLLITLYLCIHSLACSKSTILLSLTIVCFLSVIFMLIGFIIWGIKQESDVDFSFGITVVASILCLIAGILSLVQMRKSGLA
ncbi:uncharacterized protein LOC106160735 [Lingula anatina]|uniref:Uncharacterized protein LOC106160735 n=1 Tax=Lingula anatina TaxID=7574 RepID=A0A1S3I4U7_LINAN|nr:uncharacterized protein LOC106160735 [Lingula anatina]|eukprot:XP_013392856.1 uncharacterized protein LOC106160735 [Lingula anatina]